MSKQSIELKGVRVHNLKNIDLNIRLNQFVVITGVSGSGKSSLAFDTLYAEGQRRYVESLSSYARQFLGRLNKPEWNPACRGDRTKSEYLEPAFNRGDIHGTLRLYQTVVCQNR